MSYYLKRTLNFNQTPAATKFFDIPIYIIILFLFIVAAFLRYFIAAQDLTYLDRLFLPDDTYYILSISRSLAHGLGPSIDSGHLTNGFQPLITLFQVPIFWLGFDLDEAVILAIYLSALFGSLTTILISGFIFWFAGQRLAIIGGLLWAISPIIIKNDLNGLETSLTGFLCLASLSLTIYLDKNPQHKNGFSFLGILLGLCFLSRIDTCFLIMTVSIFGFYYWHLHQVIKVLSFAFLTALPWWCYSIIHFGTIIPSSFTAIKLLVDSNHISLFNLLLISWYNINSWLPFFNISKIFNFWLLLICTIFSIFVLIKGSLQLKKYTVLFIIPCILLYLFYSFYFTAFWFWSRYFYFIFLVLIISFALVFKDYSPEKNLSLSTFIFLFLLANYLSLFPFFSEPSHVLDNRIEGIKGYRDVALEIKKQIHSHEVLAAMQSGALSYYLNKTIRVLNLDGVVNFDSLKAIENREILNYFKAEKITHVADWQNNILRIFSLQKNSTNYCLIPLFKTAKQASEQFILYRYVERCS